MKDGTPEAATQQEEKKPLPKRASCKSCPAYYEPCMWSGSGDNPAHWIVVGVAPSGFTVGANQPFSGQDGRLFKKIVGNLPKFDPSSKHANNGLKIYYTYAVQWGQGKVTKEHQDNCRVNLIREISMVRGANNGAPPVIIALGPDVARALGLRIQKIDDSIGRFMNVGIPSATGNVSYTVLPLMSMADLNRRPGAISVVSALLDRATKLALGMMGTEQTAKAPVTVEGAPPALTSNYTTPKTIEEVKELVDHVLNYTGRVEDAPSTWTISLDTETNTLNMHDPASKILMLSVGWDDDKAASILLDHPETPYDSAAAWDHVKRLLESPKPKVFHNAKFDLQGLWLRYGIQVNNVRWDTLLGEHWLDEDKKGLYGLKKLTPLYVPTLAGYDDELQKALRGAEEEANKEKKKAAKLENVAAVASGEEAPVKKKRVAKKKTGGYEQAPLPTLLQYAATDADVTRRILRAQIDRLKKLQKTPEARHVMNTLYLPATKTLARMEYRGFPVDRAYLRQLEADVLTMRDGALAELKRNFDPNLNYGSPAQVSAYMQKLKFDALPGKEFGTTDKEALKKYGTLYGLSDPRGKFATDVLVYRTANDAKNKFIDKIKSYMADHDGKIHTSFHLAGTATGRLSSSNPNLQNLPKYICRVTHKDSAGTETTLHKGFNSKKLFVPSNPDYVLCNADIKAAELRVYTAYSQDQKMIDALVSGTDVHSMVAANAYGLSYEEIMAGKGKDPRITKMRDDSKRVVFGSFYGAGANKIAEQIGGTREDGQRLIDMLYKTFPDLANYIMHTRNEVKNLGYVRTFFSRYRRFKMANLGTRYYEEACREAVNMKIQSTASDLLLSQLCEIDDVIEREIGGRLLITVHDAMTFELPRENADKVKPFLTKWITERVAEKFVWLQVPFAFDFEIGENYGELKEVK